MKKLFVFLFVLYTGILSAHQVNVRLFSVMKVSGVTLSVYSGQYTLWADNKRLEDTLANGVIQLIAINDSIEIRVPGDTLGRCAWFKLEPVGMDASFRIKPTNINTGTRTYDDALRVNAKGGLLQTVNTADIEEYVGGVVESESGGNTVKEFYKVQSILCRTYALNHLYRHTLEGFDLCDGVHCQVYRSRTSQQHIHDAVFETEGLVLVDRNLSLITAAFHSNCGGQTANSEDVWSLSLPYLRSVPDSFCLRMPHARWTRKIAREDWLSYLSLKHKYPVNDSASCYQALNFSQGSRSVYFIHGNLRIPLKTIRSDWQLRSAYFSIEEQKDSVVFRGRGYGHGVGLCQEGAIRMARMKWTYQNIIPYYFKGVSIIHLSKLDFFREE
jgi:stage II sporulation protein D